MAAELKGKKSKKEKRTKTTEDTMNVVVVEEEARTSEPSPPKKRKRKAIEDDVLDGADKKVCVDKALPEGNGLGVCLPCRSLLYGALANDTFSPTSLSW